MSVYVGSAADIAGIAVDGSQEAEYVAKVRALNPIAYWILGEHAPDTTAVCQSDRNQNGTHVGVTLGNVGIGDGQVCPSYDGTNDYTDVDTAALVSAFDGDEGTALIWGKMSAGGIWTDGSNRYALSLIVDGNNYIFLRKNVANNTLGWYYTAGGVAEAVTLGALVTTGWMSIALTWSSAADEVKAFYNGAQTGLTQAGLGVWAGSLVTATIGAYNTAPASAWSGYLAHCALWDSALAPATVLSLATV